MTSFTHLPERNSAICRSINAVRDRAGRAGGCDSLSRNRESQIDRPEIIIICRWKTGAANYAARLTAPAAPGRRGSPAGLLNWFRPVAGCSLFLCARIAIQSLAKSFRICAPVFHFNLSAQATGLAVVVYGQDDDRREMKCPTKALKDSTK